MLTERKSTGYQNIEKFIDIRPTRFLVDKAIKNQKDAEDSFWEPQTTRAASFDLSETTINDFIWKEEGKLYLANDSHQFH